MSSSFDPETVNLWKHFVRWYKEKFQTENNPDHVNSSEDKLCWEAFRAGARAAELINKGPKTFVQNQGNKNG